MALHHFESGASSSDDGASRGVKRSIEEVGEVQRQQWREQISGAVERAHNCTQQDEDQKHGH